MITKELIKQIVDEYKGFDLAEHLSTQLKLMEDIRKGIKIIHQDMDRENLRHEAAIRAYKEKLKAYREQCNHWTRTYYADPSGNNDSFYECDICGKEF